MLALHPFSYTHTVSVFDLIILIILAAFTLRGIWKGMVSQIVSAISLIVCWIVATRFGSLVAPTIPLEAPWDQVAAMAVVFLITWIAIRFAYTALEKLIKDWHLQKLNTLFGGLIGFTKGLLLCLIITFFAVMFSDSSRSVVFNSTSGSHLVHIITRVSLFVPTDSYEFVHVQFAQFQSQVDKAVPGLNPETMHDQSSETMQKLLAQLQGKTEPHSSSLWSALSKWWYGTKDDVVEVETMSPIPRTVQNSERNVSPAMTYMPPVSQSPVRPTNASANDPQPIATKPAVVVEDFFAVRQSFPTVSSPVQQPMAMISEIASPLSSSLPALPTLAPLSILPDTTELLPMLPPSHPIGSDLLLHNSGRSTNPSTSAKVFLPQ